MTSTLPCRLITRQRSHIGLTDALTFMGRCGKPRQDTARPRLSMLANAVQQPSGALGRQPGDCRSSDADFREREDARTVFGHRDRVLEVACKRVVARVDRPAVVAREDAGLAGGDHRLDREGHPGREERAAAGLSEVRDLRLLVHRPPDPVADELADDREARLLGRALDSRRDVADPVPGARLSYPGLEGGLTD